MFRWCFSEWGVDSSLIVGIMAKLSGSPIKTFSIGFEEKEFDELPYARLISERFGTEHHEFIVKPDAIEILPKLVWHYNEPFADSSAIPTYYVANMTKDFVKVVLTGMRVTRILRVTRDICKVDGQPPSRKSQKN